MSGSMIPGMVSSMMRGKSVTCRFWRASVIRAISPWLYVELMMKAERVSSLGVEGVAFFFGSVGDGVLA